MEQQLTLIDHTDERLNLPSAPIIGGSQECMDLIERMRNAENAKICAGMAAIQYGIASTVFMYRKKKDGDLFFMVNPKLLERSDEVVWGAEGCFSDKLNPVSDDVAHRIPPKSYWVPRAKWVTMSFVDAQGEPQQETFKNFLARVVQHEFDHTLGLRCFQKDGAREICGTEDANFTAAELESMATCKQARQTQDWDTVECFTPPSE
eukprot:TRINITY_DN67625_c9_g1_i1.p1 TRINITY_DN67625_c9_g1~~TRINITY_DN67625_c9_g1_i1.p1  ORF type:complete len:206 (-),score=29.17 TRINITY_DN67625_c9_g1_i1:276-893(-)